MFDPSTFTMREHMTGIVGAFGCAVAAVGVAFLVGWPVLPVLVGSGVGWFFGTGVMAVWLLDRVKAAEAGGDDS